MSSELPQGLRQRVNAWLAENDQSSQREAVRTLSARYAAGQASTAIGLAPYLAARMPATFAAVATVLAEVAKLSPEFAPTTMLDVGAGPGTASFAARAQWVSLKHFTLVESDPRFAELAKALAHNELPNFEILHQRLQQLERRAEVVIAAYVMVEQPETEVPAVALKLWRACDDTLVLVEPGTPQGFARLRAARIALINEGANLIGPCTHQNACPMAGNDWCHFKARLARSREHMHAKGAIVPFEDEAYSWLAVKRFPVTREQARIIAPPKASKVGIRLNLCSATGLQEELIASRAKATYKRARKLKWGDGFSLSESGEA